MSRRAASDKTGNSADTLAAAPALTAAAAAAAAELFTGVPSLMATRASRTCADQDA
jgi:hypothetical protein